MLEVYFEENHEAELFYQLMIKEKRKWKAIRKRMKKNLVQVIFLHDLSVAEMRKEIAPFLSLVFISTRELGMIRDILKNKYYFSNVEEINRITEIAISLLEKDEPIYAEVIHQHELRDILTTIFMMHIDTTSTLIQFDSIIHFRLHHYVTQLTELIGLAIDEFKREEEYQDFIHSIREFVLKKAPEEKVVHVLQGEYFQIFRDNGKVFSREDLKELKARFPTFILGLEKDEWDISPLIMLAPEHIYLYGEDEQEPRTHTIMNIFQEHFTFFQKEWFPFLSIEEES